jgi:hypothetical protein
MRSMIRATLRGGTDVKITTFRRLSVILFFVFLVWPNPESAMSRGTVQSPLKDSETIHTTTYCNAWRWFSGLIGKGSKYWK